MFETTQENQDFLKYMQNVFKPTKEDLEKVITKDEQKELCLKHKCRVDMWRWNPVYEFRWAFEIKGRYQNWTDKKKLKMLSKSVNLMKPHEFCSDEEMLEIRRNEWEIRKKDSILSLNVWASDRKKKQKEIEIYEAEEQDLFHDDDIGEPESQEMQPAEFRSTTQMYTNLKKPTKAYLERVITKEEQIELCLKHKCRVNIWRWNAVNKHRLEFEDKGRYQNWICSDEEIVQIRRNEWEIRKMNSILSLELWASDRKQKEKQLERYEAEQQTNSDPDSDILGFLDDLSGLESQEIPSFELFSSIYEKIDDKCFPASKNESQGKQPAKAPTDVDPLLDNLLDVNTESLTVDTKFLTQSEMAHSSEQDHQLLDNLLDVNTESLTVDTKFLTQSEMAHLSEQDHQLSRTTPYKQFNKETCFSSTIITNEF